MKVLLIFLLGANSALGDIFSYDLGAVNGPSSWGGYCNGNNAQSPINIDRASTTPTSNYLPFKFYGYDERPDVMEYTNTYPTPLVKIPRTASQPRAPFIVEGGLPRLDVFQFEHIEFHWGSDDFSGSEHTINNEHFPLEMQLVHFNRKYSQTINGSIYETEFDGRSNEDTLAILSVMFKLQKKHNEKLEPLIRALKSIRSPNTVLKANDPLTFKLFDVMPDDLDHFWRYQGSTTYPDCYESVIWSIFHDTVGISGRQLDEFRNLLYTGPGGTTYLMRNFRSVQPLNGRTVFAVDTNQYNRECQQSGLWKTSDYIHWRESREEFSFLGSVHYCLGGEAEDGPYVGLMPVGKLREFRNRWADEMYFSDGKFENHFCQARLFRVNALKAKDGTWREYPSGHEVLFHHYPEFDKDHGDIGDTLVWDSHRDRLLIQDDENDFHALCYREKDRCQYCGGFDQGAECSNAGNCVGRACRCDLGFSGTYCQLEPLVEFGAFAISSSSNFNPDSYYDFRTGLNCEYFHYGSIPRSDNQVKATFIFDRAIVCNINNLDGQCAYFWPGNRTWIQFSRSSIYAHDDGEAEVFKVHGEDKFWMIAGGSNSVATEILTSDLKWSNGPDLPILVTDFCMVQISDCEMAIIGGRVRDNPLSTATPSKQIWIYNFETNAWTQGPNLNYNRVKHSCVRIKDPHTNHWNVVISGGFRDQFNSFNEDNTEAWDVKTNIVKSLYDSSFSSQGTRFQPLPDYFEWADELTDYQAIFARGSNFNSDMSNIWIFDLENGFREDTAGDSAFVASESDMAGAVVPAGYFECYYEF